MAPMNRWDDLFADLEGRIADADASAWAADAAEQGRAERARLTLAERLHAQSGTLRFALVGGATVEGRVGDHGDGWVLLGTARGDVLLPLVAIASVIGLGPQAATDRPDPGSDAPGRPTPRPGLPSVLRALVRRRAAVEVRLLGTTAADGPLTGTLDAVYADHVDLAAHAADVPRRPANVVAVQAIRTAALLSVRLL